MMNTETKRHIDNARQVLVGVVPNPSTQIDQITNALTYKFMDDMDQSVIKIGGKPTFFTGDLEKYAWTRLMDSRIGSQERMNLYSEALIKFSQAKQLPQLFRDIFKLAILPYRSPEVLDLFLKEINYFDYSHSEELGNAFEYLLSVMGSQGDAGMFRTPRHIIEFIVDVINPTKDDKVLDPACGTAGFLISAYKHILEQHDGKNDPNKKEQPLTPEQKKKLTSNFIGYDISPDMVRLSKVNMYLHNFKDPQIVAYNTLANEERWNDKFDVIFANPPFMSPKGASKPHSKFSIQASKSEILFVDYIMNHLRPKGRAGVIVPDGIVFASSNANVQLRKNLVEDGLYAVVSLPSGVFNPYAGVKTSILLLDNELAKQKTEILFIKIENDGFDLGATKRPISKNDLPVALEILNKWSAGEKVESKLAVYVEKSKIAENGDYNLSGDRYRVATDYTNAKWPSFTLKELEESGDITLGRGQVISKKDLEADPGIYPVYSSSAQGIGEFGQYGKYMFDEELITWSVDGGGRFFYRPKHKFSVTNVSGWIRINTPQKISAKYLFRVLDIEWLDKSFDYVAKAHPSVIREMYKIPLPPLEIQEQVVEQIDGYQKIIDGIQQAVSAWKPRIEIDPKWEKVKLGEVCNFIDYRGKTPQKTMSGIPLITAKNIKKGYITEEPKEYIAESDYDSWMTRGLPRSGDVLITTEAPLGNVALVDTGKKFALAQRIINLSPKSNSDLVGGYLMYTLLSDELQNSLINNQSGSTVYGIKASVLKTVEIPLPPLEIQKQIVEKIEFERSGIEKAKELLPTFRQHIKNTIAKLWEE